MLLRLNVAENMGYFAGIAFVQSCAPLFFSEILLKSKFPIFLSLWLLVEIHGSFHLDGLSAKLLQTLNLILRLPKNIFIPQRHFFLTIPFPMMFFHDAIDLVVNRLDIVLFEAKDTVGMD